MDPRNTYSGEVDAAVTTQEERQWAAMAHGGALLGWVLSLGLGAIVIPLLILIIKGPTSDFVTDHARECLNYQITAFIVAGIFLLLCLILIGIPLLIGFGVLSLVWMTIATVRAANGERYRYPFCFRFLR
jgi:uncharacterized Tic20 family protein